MLNEYLLKIGSSKRVITFANHGKRTKGWIVPEEPAAVKDKMLEYVRQSMEEVLKQIAGEPRKKSDSRSLDSVLFGTAEEDEDDENERESQEPLRKF